MALSPDTDPKLAEYAHPEKLVTTEWLAEHLDQPGLVVVESVVDVSGAPVLLEVREEGGNRGVRVEESR